MRIADKRELPVTRVIAGCFVAVLLAVVASGQAAGKMQPLPGLEATVVKVERAPTAVLRDCPPGTNTVTAVSKPGEQFAIVTIAFKAAAGFKPSPMLRPSVLDTADKKFNTASTLVDPDGVPEYSCSFPFRVPDGTKLKTLQIASGSVDLTSFDK